jgi:hypothetical protein
MVVLTFFTPGYRERNMHVTGRNGQPEVAENQRFSRGREDAAVHSRERVSVCGQIRGRAVPAPVEEVSCPESGAGLSAFRQTDC